MGDFPKEVYIKVDHNLIEKMGKELSFFKKKFKIGISGKALITNMQNKNLYL